MSLTSYRAAPPREEVVGRQSSVVRKKNMQFFLTTDDCRRATWFGRPGGDLLSRVLRRSTMGAGGFHGRVRDGIGCRHPAMATRSSKPRALRGMCLLPEGVCGQVPVRWIVHCFDRALVSCVFAELCGLLRQPLSKHRVWMIAVHVG